MLPDGGAAVVHDSTDLATFPFEADSVARRLAGAERLWLVPRVGPRMLLAEAANFASRPDLSRDGSALAFVEQRTGYTRLYGLRLHDLERRLIEAASAPSEIASPRLSADGARVLYSMRDIETGRSTLRVAYTHVDRHSRGLLADPIDARWVELALTPDGARQAWVAVLARDDAAPALPAPAEDGPSVAHVEASLLLLDADTGHVVARQPLHEHSVHAIGDVHDDGRVWLSWQDDASCGFARYQPGHALEWITSDLCPKHIVGGASGVFAHALVGSAARTRQLVRIDTATTRIDLVSRGALDAQTPQPAARAQGLVYERVLPRKYGELQHVAVCFR